MRATTGTVRVAMVVATHGGNRRTVRMAMVSMCMTIAVPAATTIVFQQWLFQIAMCMAPSIAMAMAIAMAPSIATVSRARHCNQTNKQQSE